MTADCNYSKQVWNYFASAGVVPQQPPPTTCEGLQQWWTSMVGHPQANTSSQTEQAVLYIAWNLWKERCRRVFDNKEVGVSQLVIFIKEDMTNWHLAHQFWEE
jgi:hypothetical protein